MYIRGDYWMVCDTCGFDIRASRMKKQWDGMMVCSQCFEQRNPQDFVRAKMDRIRVLVARPAPAIEIRTTTLSANATKGAKTITVTSATYIANKDSIGIVYESHDEQWDSAAEKIQWTQVDGAPVGTTVTLVDPLIENAASGNTVYLSQAQGPSFISTLTTGANL